MLSNLFKPSSVLTILVRLVIDDGDDDYDDDDDDDDDDDVIYLLGITRSLVVPAYSSYYCFQS